MLVTARSGPDISPGSLAWVGDGDEKLGAWAWKMLSSGFAHPLVRFSQSMGFQPMCSHRGVQAGQTRARAAVGALI